LETLEALEAVVELLAKREQELAELQQVVERLKAENIELMQGKAASGQPAQAQSAQPAAEQPVARQTPPQPAHSEPAAAVARPAAPVGVKTVMIADSNRLFRINLKSILDSNGFALVGEAATPIEILPRAKETNPDIMILDYGMSGLDFKTTIAALRQVLPSCKIVVLSNSMGRDEIYETIKAGASDFVMKPIHHIRFVSVLKGLYTSKKN